MHADGEHGDIALVALQVLDQRRERRVDVPQLHAQVQRQLLGELGIDAGEGLVARIAIGDAVVVGPDADPHRAGGGDAVGHRTGMAVPRGQAGGQGEGQCGADGGE